MAKRRTKKRTHAGARPAAPGEVQRPGEKTPRSMVVRIGAGEVGPSVSQLVKDTRSMLEPGTASRLKERKSNKLRDYTTMAGPLGVSHLLLFSRSDSGNTNLRVATTPRGPTLHFRVDKYSLCKDVMKSMRRPKGQSGAEYLTPPLLVMNNFVQTQNPGPDAAHTPDSNPVPKHLESLTTTIFQSLFAPISPNTTSLKTIKRVMLLDRVPAKDPSNPHAFVLQLRHYAISAVTPKSELPKALRKLEQADHIRRRDSSRLPNLGNLDDVADFLLDPSAASGFTTASDTEADTDAEVEVLAPEDRKVLTKEERQRIRDSQRARATGANAEATGDAPAAPRPAPAPRKTKTTKKAIKLQELGPRMTLRLTKVEEGLCGGKILWHEYISKSVTEQRRQDQEWAVRNKQKEERRRIQKENVERKKKERKAAGKTVDDEDDDDDDDDDMADYDPRDDEWDSEGLDDEGAGDVGAAAEESDDEMG